ncbi:hypothetical protein [Microlunatus speluncae]|uniref:hypothetical protein n=1 Tax=Microlunatus speluncae TaxID=2594267 RepID=UPI001266548E|nr:hypothetical protein [Microlunatus speluncae]
MSLNSDYFVNTAVQQRRADLIAEAESDRLARLARSTRTGWLRRLRSALRRPQTPVSAPVTEPAVREPEREPSSEARQLVGAGRSHGA